MDGFHDLGGADVFFAGEVGEGAGDFEDAVVGAGGEVEGFHGLLKEVGGVFVELAVGADLARGHGGVGEEAGGAFEAFGLDGACGDDAFADFFGFFAAGGAGEFFVFDEGDFDMEVDAIEEGAGDALAVVFDLARIATAVAFGVAEEAAGAGIEGGDEDAFGREGKGASGAGDSDFTVFEGLAEDFEGGAAEFGEFVKEEDSVVRKGDFAGAGVGAAAEESGVGDGVVGRAKGSGDEEGFFRVEEAGDGVDLGGLDGFVFAHVGHDGGKAFGEHGLAGSGRPYHQDVVAAGDGDFEGALDVGLAFDVFEVDFVAALGAKEFLTIELEGGDGAFAGEVVIGLVEVGDGDDFDAFSDGGFGGVLGGDEDFLAAAVLGFDGDGEDAFDGADGSVEGEFAHDGEVVFVGKGGFHAVGRDGEGDRKVEGGAFFFEVGGGEIDDIDDAVAKAGGGDGRTDAHGGLANGGVGEADDDGSGLFAVAAVDFDFHFDGVHPA